MERLIADGAVVRLLPGVGQPVVLVVALLVEPLPAELADPGPVALVDPHVGVEGGAAVERLAAGAALVRLVVRVDDLVAAQSGRLAEPLAADLANEGASTCIYACGRN